MSVGFQFNFNMKTFYFLFFFVLLLKCWSFMRYAWLNGKQYFIYWRIRHYLFRKRRVNLSKVVTYWNRFIVHTRQTFILWQRFFFDRRLLKTLTFLTVSLWITFINTDMIFWIKNCFNLLFYLNRSLQFNIFFF